MSTDLKAKNQRAYQLYRKAMWETGDGEFARFIRDVTDEDILVEFDVRERQESGLWKTLEVRALYPYDTTIKKTFTFERVLSPFQTTAWFVLKVEKFIEEVEEVFSQPWSFSISWKKETETFCSLQQKGFSFFEGKQKYLTDMLLELINKNPSIVEAKIDCVDESGMPQKFKTSETRTASDILTLTTNLDDLDMIANLMLMVEKEGAENFFYRLGITIKGAVIDPNRRSEVMSKIHEAIDYMTKGSLSKNVVLRDFDGELVFSGLYEEESCE